MSFSPSQPIADADYLLGRASAEADAAASADQPVSAEAHHRLASLYLDRLFGASGQAPQPQSSRRLAAPERKTLATAPFRLLKPVGDPADFTDLLVRLP